VTCSHEQRVERCFQILGLGETGKATEPKLRLRRGTDSHKVAEEGMDLVSCRSTELDVGH